MRAWLGRLGALVVGALVGGGVMLAIQDADRAGGRQDGAAPASESTAPAPTSTVPTTGPEPAAGGTDLLLAWTPGGLPAGFAGAAAAVDGVAEAAVVRGDPIDLARSVAADGRVVDQPAAGWFIPLDAIAIEPASYATVVPVADRAVVASLAPGEGLLGATSARLRQLGPGGRLDLAGGGSVTVRAVVPDVTIGGAELAVDRATGAALGISTERALLVAHSGDRAPVEAALAAMVPPGLPLRFRARGETPFLRAGDAVLPQVVLKDVFGEFAYRPGPRGDRDVEIDPTWMASNVTEVELPLIGRARCHRAVVPALTAALRRLEQANVTPALGPNDFDGCFVPRRIRPGAPLSHHSWGIALDLGYEDNPTAVVAAQDPRLVDIMRRAGFGWGGGWLVPDPAHFEYVAPPST
jgi:hypothetical protein